jgi:YD repeat-containing protein
MILKLFRLFFVVLLLSFSTSLFAIVDMKNANFSNSWVDLEVPGSGFDLKVTRTYNSRSLFSGMFGFGWCSEFETSIDISAEGVIKLTECGAGQEVTFRSKESIKNLSQIKDGTTFLISGQGVENIVFNKGAYNRNLPDGSSQRFNLKGRLTHLYDKNGNFLKFELDQDGTIREIVDNNGRKLNFKYYPSKKVRQIIGPSGTNAEYKFSNQDDLAWVKNAWTNIYTYEYDDLHNLTKVIWPDKTFISLKYDTKKDWVVSFQDRDQCVEVYKYEFSDKNPQNHYWSTVKKTCGKEVVNESRHEFWYKPMSNGESYLERVASNVNGNVTDITYHETFGKPLMIVRNKEKFTFEYYPNGLVKVKTGPDVKQTFQYDPKSNKVSSVTTQILNAKGKVAETKKSEFRYDEKSNLVFAQNSDGQKINMTYDSKGRIATITDQAKKVVKIDYEERFGKPHIVSRPGLGTIKVTYKKNGDIDKVNSNEGPSVAMQVASTFNNLLDIISPATAEIYN